LSGIRIGRGLTSSFDRREIQTIEEPGGDKLPRHCNLHSYRRAVRRDPHADFHADSVE
jgi:hypothetical protein